MNKYTVFKNAVNFFLSLSIIILIILKEFNIHLNIKLVEKLYFLTSADILENSNSDINLGVIT